MTFVVLDPSDLSPVGVNPLSGPAPDLVADNCSQFSPACTPDSWGPRLSETLHAVCDVGAHRA